MKIILNWNLTTTARLTAAREARARSGRRAARAALLATALAAAPVAAASSDSAEAWAERAQLVMGTIARVAVAAADVRDVAPSAPAFDAAFAALREVDVAMSLYRADSALVRVNAFAAERGVPVDSALFELLARALFLSVATDGAFDVTILPLLRAHGAYRELTHLGPIDPGAVGFAALELDAAARTVRFRRRGMGIDLGAIAKGFALDRARAAVIASGATAARLDVGGMVATVGAGPEGWHVGVRDPGSPGEMLGLLTLVSTDAVATSGNYERDFAAEGWDQPSHVYDPRDGSPVPCGRAVTAWAPDATTADALATALLVLGPERGRDVLARLGGVGALFVEGAGASRTLVLAGRPPLAWIPADASTSRHHHPS